jgi:hypothetical protein
MKSASTLLSPLLLSEISATTTACNIVKQNQKITIYNTQIKTPTSKDFYRETDNIT